jgi:hypothetical protein
MKKIIIGYPKLNKKQKKEKRINALKSFFNEIIKGILIIGSVLIVPGYLGYFASEKVRPDFGEFVLFFSVIGGAFLASSLLNRIDQKNKKKV